MTMLFLVGITPWDRRGHERLTKLLEWYKPEVVAVAYSHETIDDLRRGLHDPSARQELSAAKGSRLQDMYAYDYYAVAAYAELHNIELILADPLHRRQENIARTTNEIDEMVERHYHAYTYVSDAQQALLTPHQAAMAARVGKLSGNVLFPVGLEHLFSHHYNLRYRLQGALTLTCRLNEADNMETLAQRLPLQFLRW